MRALNKGSVSAKVINAFLVTHLLLDNPVFFVMTSVVVTMRVNSSNLTLSNLLPSFSTLTGVWAYLYYYPSSLK